MPPNIPERVAMLEAVLPIVRQTLGEVRSELSGIMSAVEVIKNKVETINLERSRWKDPMLYVTLLAVVVSIYAVLIK